MCALPYAVLPRRAVPHKRLVVLKRHNHWLCSLSLGCHSVLSYTSACPLDSQAHKTRMRPSRSSYSAANRYSRVDIPCSTYSPGESTGVAVQNRQAACTSSSDVTCFRALEAEPPCPRRRGRTDFCSVLAYLAKHARCTRASCALLYPHIQINRSGTVTNECSSQEKDFLPLFWFADSSRARQHNEQECYHFSNPPLSTTQQQTQKRATPETYPERHFG